MTTTPEQKAALRRRLNRLDWLKAEVRREAEALQDMLLCLDPRLADPNSGVALNRRTLEIEEPGAP